MARLSTSHVLTWGIRQNVFKFVAVVVGGVVPSLGRGAVVGIVGCALSRWHLQWVAVVVIGSICSLCLLSCELEQALVLLPETSRTNTKLNFNYLIFAICYPLFATHMISGPEIQGTRTLIEGGSDNTFVGQNFPFFFFFSLLSFIIIIN